MYLTAIDLDGNKQFTKERWERRDGGVALYVREQYDCLEFQYENGEKPFESLWFKFRDKSSKVWKERVVLDVSYRSPHEEDEIHEALFGQLTEVSRSKALVLMWDFNHPDICQDSNTEVHRQSRKFWECVGDNFLVKVLEEPTKVLLLLTCCSPRVCLHYSPNSN